MHKNLCVYERKRKRVNGSASVFDRNTCVLRLKHAFFERKRMCERRA